MQYVGAFLLDDSEIILKYLSFKGESKSSSRKILVILMSALLLWEKWQKEQESPT